MPKCMICAFSHTDSIVPHITAGHKGGLGRYRLFFSQPVVSETVYRSLENLTLGAGPVDTALISEISEEDRIFLVEERLKPRGPSSEITVTEDF